MNTGKLIKIFWMNKFRVHVFFGVCLLSILVLFIIKILYTRGNVKCDWEGETLIFDPDRILIDHFNRTLEKVRRHGKTYVPENWRSLENKTIYIVTTYRSGSTFFAEAISSHPAVFYHYEPLETFNINSIPEVQLEDAINTTRNLATCNYSALGKYLNWIKRRTNLLKFNSKTEICKYLLHECLKPDFLSQACKSFPIQLFKLVRILISELEPIFRENENSHIIFLVRDPRASYVSRVNADMAGRDYDNPQMFCTRLNSNMNSFKRFQLQNPKRFHLVKFEDVARNPFDKFRELFANLGVLWDPTVDDYLEKHTKIHVKGAHSTHRVSQSRIHHWKQDIDVEILKILELHCEQFMRELNYTKLV